VQVGVECRTCHSRAACCYNVATHYIVTNCDKQQLHCGIGSQPDTEPPAGQRDLLGLYKKGHSGITMINLNGFYVASPVSSHTGPPAGQRDLLGLYKKGHSGTTMINLNGFYVASPVSSHTGPPAGLRDLLGLHERGHSGIDIYNDRS